MGPKWRPVGSIKLGLQTFSQKWSLSTPLAFDHGNWEANATTFPRYKERAGSSESELRSSAPRTTQATAPPLKLSSPRVTKPTAATPFCNGAAGVGAAPEEGVGARGARRLGPRHPHPHLAKVRKRATRKWWIDPR